MSTPTPAGEAVGRAVSVAKAIWAFVVPLVGAFFASLAANEGELERMDPLELLVVLATAVSASVAVYQAPRFKSGA